MTNPTNTENHPNHPDGINEKNESSSQEVALLFKSNAVASEDRLADTTMLPQQHDVTGRSEPMIHTATLNMETTNNGASQGPNRMAESAVLDPDEAADEKEDHLDTTTAPLSLSPPSTLPTSPTNTTTTHPVLRAGKRPSPWREPRTTGRPPPPAREIIKGVHLEHDDDDDEETRRKKQVRLQKRKERRCKYLCSGSIFVNVPMTVTADLGVALRRGREHRIQALYRHFPQLQTKTTANGVDGNDQVDHENGPKRDKAAPKKILRHVPQPHEYANVIDYLEAKYVQGVVISDDLDEYDDKSGGNMEEDDEEGQGSVYSETSFLDDTGLQRTVAEQVLGHTTTTKLELMNHEDGGFFVNVGDLEVEETDLTQEMYDPIHDTSKESLKKKKSRKRKTSSNENENRHADNIGKPTGSAISSKNNKVTKLAAKPGPVATNSTDVVPKDTKSPIPAKNKKMKIEERKPDLDVTISPKVKKESVIKTESKIHQNPVTMKLQKIASRKKSEITEHLSKLTAIIENLTDEELPRKAKPKRTRLVVQVPVGKQPGDTITCANPYVPGQKFKVKVPANVKAGEKFKVNVSKPAEDNDDDNLGEDGLVRDHNKFNRDFYDVLDDYAKAFDEWCDAEGAYRRAIDDKTFTSHYMKRSKCDDLVSLFPNDTKTEISVEYLKKVIRRARQNKHKRELTLAKQQMSFIEEHQDLIAQNSDGDNNDSADEDDDEDDNDEDNVDDDNNPNKKPNSFDEEDNNEIEARYKSLKANSSAKGPVTKRGMKPLRTAILPEFSSAFPSIPFRIKDFAEVS